MRHLEPPELDRLEHLRDDGGALTPDTRVLTVWRDRGLVRDAAPVEARVSDLPVADCRELVLLGDVAGSRYASRSAGSAERAERIEADTGGRFEGLRTTAATLPPVHAALLYYAAALHAWHERTRFCGRCGAPTVAGRTGHQRTCTGDACGDTLFPRTDPAIITLLRRDDRALLLHQPQWPPGRFSTLAGFVEPGETLEGAVAREVSEEVGLRVARTEYVASQPWPFPHTLMIGFRCWVEPGEVIHGEEVAETRWLTRDGLRRALRDRQLTIPPPYSLSRSLIEEWLAEE